jgi:hypothetical protein
MSWPKGRKRPELSGENHWIWGKKRPDLREFNKKRMKENNPMNDADSHRRSVEHHRSMRGKNNPMFGKKRPDRSEWMKKMPKDPKVRAKMKEAWTPERRKKFIDWMKNGGASYISSCNKNPSKEQVQLYEKIKILYPLAILNYP